jgi:hypothetical protein
MAREKPVGEGELGGVQSGFKGVRGKNKGSFDSGSPRSTTPASENRARRGPRM